ncbi:hypothetical protein Tco_1457669 [Tanacetum coccineum]
MFQELSDLAVKKTLPGRSPVKVTRNSAIHLLVLLVQVKIDSERIVTKSLYIQAARDIECKESVSGLVAEQTEVQAISCSKP